MYVVRIVLDAANDVNVFSENADGGPSDDVRRFLHTNEIEKSKRRRHKKSEPPKPFFRSRRQPGVDQRERDAARVGCGSEIRPNFRFDENDLHGLNRRESASHDRPEIERRVEHLDPTRNMLACKRKPGCRGRGQNKAHLRLKLPDRFREFERDYDLAHADRMEPCRFLRGEPPAKIDIVNADALSKLVPVIAAPEHSHQIPREKKQQTDWPKQIVDETNHFVMVAVHRNEDERARRKNKTSVAP